MQANKRMQNIFRSSQKYIGPEKKKKRMATNLDHLSR